MSLVAYPDSDDDPSLCSASPPPPRKKQRRSSREESSADKDISPDLPPLPASFHNLYSSTVRVSTTDDPSLHAGRKRIVPHIPGNWATHVYLEWFPDSTQQAHLNDLLAAVQKTSDAHHGVSDTENHIHSLLETPLGVPLPLHISLSAPLVLRTQSKTSFLNSLITTLAPALDSLRAGLTVSPTTLTWHPNENGSRGFLVLGLLELHDRHRPPRRTQTRSRRQEGKTEKRAESQECVIAGNERRAGDGGLRGGREARLGSETWAEAETQQCTLEENVAEDEIAESEIFGRDERADYNNSNSNGIANPRLNALLEATNRVAHNFNQPQLYIKSAPVQQKQPRRQQQGVHYSTPEPATQSPERDFSTSFHISIAWSLSLPSVSFTVPRTTAPSTTFPTAATTSSSAPPPPSSTPPTIPSHPWPSDVKKALQKVKRLRIHFSELKIRIGQDVASLSFGAAAATAAKNRGYAWR